MKILYVFPHPDDECFGPALVMSHQRRQGHEVYLLTLTKGGATKQRHKYGYSIEEMGEVRYKEMQNVAKAIDLSGLTVLDFPDSGLKEMDPRDIENAIRKEIEKIKPEVIVSYSVYGVSGFFDHLVCHAVVKRLFAEMKEQISYLKRLAMFTITEDDAKKVSKFNLKGSVDEDIDCIVTVDDIDIDNSVKALDCYETYKTTIQETDVKNVLSKNAVFEIFNEKHEPKLKDLFEGI